ncbi:acyltransferase [Thermodesulfobacteriota bacterium]
MFSGISKKWIAIKLSIKHGRSIGDNVQIIRPRLINCPKGSLYIGKDLFAGPGLYISMNSYCKLTINDAIMFGPDIMILGGNHDYSYNSNYLRYHSQDDKKSKNISIENGAWLGARTILLSGANIGEGTIIGAGSLVNHYIPPYTIAAGVPARIMKPRFKTNQELKTVLRATNSKYTIEQVVLLIEQSGVKY